MSLSRDAEKDITTSVVEPETPAVHGADSKGGRDLDAACFYLTEHRNVAHAVDLNALRRKIDWWIVPMAFLCYALQFIDKVLINVCFIFKQQICSVEVANIMIRN
jgi:hypothetical protein